MEETERYEVRWTNEDVENIYSTNDLNDAYAMYLKYLDKKDENITDLGLYDLERSLTLVVEF